MNVIRLDQEAGFTVISFWDLATAHAISLQFSGAQSHKFICVVEKYHEPLRQVFKILRQRHLAMNPKVELRYAAMGLECYVPSLLVFGSILTFPMSNKDFPEQVD